VTLRGTFYRVSALPVQRRSGVAAGASLDSEKAKGYLSRWTIDTMGETGGFSEARLTDCSGEFPRTDDRRATRGYRFGLINLTDVPGPSPGCTRAGSATRSPEASTGPRTAACSTTRSCRTSSTLLRTGGRDTPGSGR
jgi:hypothetical protein